MASVFITGSADGLGLLAANALIREGHRVVLHARDERRGQEAMEKAPGAEGVVTADLSSVDETKRLAEAVNELGRFDAVIHNAAVYHAPAGQIHAVNVIAPYVLTCLIERPQRLVYMSSGMHKGGQFVPEMFRKRGITYSDSKLHVLMLAKAVARRWPEVYSNGVDPGWVPTKMGGPGAPDDLKDGYATQVWLAVSDDDRALVSGRYFYRLQTKPNNPIADDAALQDELIDLCKEMTGLSFA